MTAKTRGSPRTGADRETTSSCSFDTGGRQTRRRLRPPSSTASRLAEWRRARRLRARATNVNFFAEKRGHTRRVMVKKRPEKSVQHNDFGFVPHQTPTPARPARSPRADACSAIPAATSRGISP
jgi:hypothetical protein